MWTRLYIELTNRVYFYLYVDHVTLTLGIVIRAVNQYSFALGKSQRSMGIIMQQVSPSKHIASTFFCLILLYFIPLCFLKDQLNIKVKIKYCHAIFTSPKSEKVNNKDTRICKVDDKVKDTINVVLASLLLTLNTFHFLLQSFYC